MESQRIPDDLELNERAYEWTTETRFVVAGVAFQIVPTPLDADPLAVGTLAFGSVACRTGCQPEIPKGFHGIPKEFRMILS